MKIMLPCSPSKSSQAIFWGLLTLVAFYFSACRPDEDDLPPKVVITQPTGTLPTYSFEGALGLTFTASDEGGISRWTVRLNDGDGVRRFSTDYFSVAEGTPEITRNFTIDLDHVHWPSGDYSLAVFAVDQAGNEGVAFKEIRYFEAPLKREKLVVLRSTGGNTLAVDTLTSSNTLASAGVINSDYSSSFAGSYHGELLVGGGNASSLRFFERESLQETSSFSQPNPLGGDFFRDIVFSKETRSYFVSCFDGLIREFGKNGLLKSSFEVAAGFRPEHIAVSGNKVICTLRSIGGNNYLLASYFRNSGTLAASAPLPAEVAAILNFEDNLIVLGNKSDGTSAAYLVNMITFGVNEVPWLISSTPVRAAIPVSNGFYAVAHDDGVWGHRFGTGQFFSGTGNGVSATHLSYDEAANHIFAVDGNSLHRISGNNFSLMSTVAAPGAVAVEALMNK